MVQAITDYLQYVEQRQPLSRFLLIASPLIFLGFMVNLAGNLLWIAAQANAQFPPMTKHLMAALVEPTTTKLAPALTIVVYLRLYDPTLTHYVQTKYIKMAAILGFLAGSIEFGLYLLQAVLLSIVVPLSISAVSVCRTPSIFMHTVTGSLVAIPVFYLIDYRLTDTVTKYDADRFLVTLTVALPLFLLAQFLHVWWNTGGSQMLTQFLGLICN